MTNRLKKIFILILGMTLGILIYFNFISIPCLFHTFFKIPCPGCGMTRAFKCILSFDIAGAFSYNILSIFLFILLICILISLVYDIIKNEKNFEEKIIKFLEKYAFFIIVLLIISFIVNIIRKI